jgi:hypothetical protein
MNKYLRLFSIQISLTGLILSVNIFAQENLQTTQDTIVSEKSMGQQATASDTTSKQETVDSQSVNNDTRDEKPQPVYSPRNLSLFDYESITTYGISVSYFHYAEAPDLNSDVQQFAAQIGTNPQNILLNGAPKSEEYGAVGGVTVSKMYNQYFSNLFIRWKAELIFGFGTTYDGSTQAQYFYDPTTKVGEIDYYAVKGLKNNIFLSGGCDVGYTFRNASYPFVLYSGVNAKVWYRDLTILQNQSSTVGAATSETYFSLNIPLGGMETIPLSPDMLFGIDNKIEYMLIGSMKMNVNSSDPNATYTYPAVSLSPKFGFRIEPFIVSYIKDNICLKTGLYFSWYQFGKSEIETATMAYNGSSQALESFYEPSSTTYSIGCSLEFATLGKLIKGIR